MLAFLNGMDSMHANLKVGMPKLRPPSMSCKASPSEEDCRPSEEDCKELILEYDSPRGGLEAMMIGLIVAVGREIFNSEYSCELIESRVTEARDREDRADPVSSNNATHHHKYRIGYTSGQPLAKKQEEVRRRTTWSSIKDFASDKSADHIGFFQNNPSMAKGWIASLGQSVAALDPSGATLFGPAFDVNMISSLVESFNPHAERAISYLFRDPFVDEDLMIPVPTLGYIPARMRDRFLDQRVFQSMTMLPLVTFGRRALVQSTA